MNINQNEYTVYLVTWCTCNPSDYLYILKEERFHVMYLYNCMMVHDML